MFTQIAYAQILGLPAIMWGGLLTFTSLCTTAALGYLFFTGRMPTGFKWHKRFAVLTLCLGFLHGSLGLLVRFVG